MKLIIVQRSKTETYRRLKDQFADDLDVNVIFERRRIPQRDRGSESAKSKQERRRLKKAFKHRDYVVVHAAENKEKA